MSESTAVIGFIGLGRMGSLLARRFVDAGYALIGFDQAGTAERLPPGARAAASTAEVAAESDVVFLSLPDGAASIAVARQLAAAAPRRATTVVDLSTIGIASARECAAILGGAGIGYVDAPVSGGPAGARDGTLAVMTATEAATFERLRPLLGVFGRNLFRLGDAPGQGQAMKLVNNFLAATNLAAASEAMLFGAREGLDLGQMIDVVNASSGRSAATQEKFPRSIIPGGYDYGFAAALMAKDVTLYRESVAAADTADPLGAAVAELWQRFNGACPGVDFTYIYEYLRQGV